MIARELKLKLTVKQEAELNRWLWHLTAVYNWAIRRIGLDAEQRIYQSRLSFVSSLKGVSFVLDIPANVIQGTLWQAHTAWQRCFKKLGGKPRFKGRRNRMNSIPYKVPIQAPVGRVIRLEGIGKLRFHKQALPDGKIKCGRIIKRASGWYLVLFIDAEPNAAKMQPGTGEIGIDFGFSTLVTLSDGTKIENPRELRKREQRHKQAQRGRRKRLAARLREREANIRKDRNHKISTNLLRAYKTIYYSDDNLRGMSRKFGKSVGEAGIGELTRMLTYKSAVMAGSEVVAVSNCNSTKTCSDCGSLTGPSGLSGLTVRLWACGACGASWDRDVNSALYTLKVGAGLALRPLATGGSNRNANVGEISNHRARLRRPAYDTD